MKVRMTNRELWEFNRALESLGAFKPASANELKYQYAAAKTKRMIKDDIDIIKEKLEAYDKLRIKICEELAPKDEKTGKPKMRNSMVMSPDGRPVQSKVYDGIDEETLNERVKALPETDVHNKFMEQEIEVEVFTYLKDSIPLGINTWTVEKLMIMESDEPVVEKDKEAEEQ